MNHSTPGLSVHHQPPEFTQTHAHRVGDATQPSHPLSSPSPPAPYLSQHQDLFQWVNSLHEVAKVLEFQLQHQSFQWTPKTDLWRSYLCWHLGFRLLVLRLVRQYISIVSVTQFMIFSYGSPRKLIGRLSLIHCMTHELYFRNSSLLTVLYYNLHHHVWFWRRVHFYICHVHWLPLSAAKLSHSS